MDYIDILKYTKNNNIYGVYDIIKNTSLQFGYPYAISLIGQIPYRNVYDILTKSNKGMLGFNYTYTEQLSTETIDYFNGYSNIKRIKTQYFMDNYKYALLKYTLTQTTDYINPTYKNEQWMSIGLTNANISWNRGDTNNYSIWFDESSNFITQEYPTFYDNTTTQKTFWINMGNTYCYNLNYTSTYSFNIYDKYYRPNDGYTFYLLLDGVQNTISTAIEHTENKLFLPGIKKYSIPFNINQGYISKGFIYNNDYVSSSNEYYNLKWTFNLITINEINNNFNLKTWLQSINIPQNWDK